MLEILAFVDSGPATGLVMILQTLEDQQGLIPNSKQQERGDSFENEENQDEDSLKMSINNEIQSRSMIEQKMQKEILIPSHNNIFHFINPYQFANFGLFM